MNKENCFPCHKEFSLSNTFFYKFKLEKSMYDIKSHMATITIQDSKKYADRKQKATMNLWRNPLEENQKRL